MAAPYAPALIDIVGGDNYSEHIQDLVSASYDASRHSSRPRAVVWASNREEVVKILALAQDRGLAIIPRGAGTGVTGMAVPEAGGLVLDLTRMNRILEISVADRLAVVEPGVVYNHLQKALAKEGFFFPPDPASGRVATIGGNVATNAGGLHGAKYGATREYVLGLTVVLPGGKVLKTGTRTMKCSSGYDLTHLFVGSEGTLGVVVEVTLKVNPRPTCFSTALAAFASLSEAGQAITAIMSCGVIPAVCEFLDSNSVAVLREYKGLSLPESEAVLLLETDGIKQEEADLHMSLILDTLAGRQTTAIRQAKDRAEAESFWEHRRGLSGLKNQLAPNWTSEDVNVPIGKIAELVSGVDAIIKKHGLGMLNFGHAGDGNFHPILLFDAEDKRQAKASHQAVEDIFRLALSLGGTLSGEHGIGLEKAPFMTWEHDEQAMDAMRAVKNLFDPKGIMNPGKMGL